MALETPDYSIIERCKESSKTVVYRGTRKTDGQAVAFKTLNTEYPTHQQIARLHYEYSIHQTLNNINGVVKSFDLIDIDNKPALVMEYISGGELSTLIDQNSPDFLGQFFNIAIQITQTMGDIHHQFIIHKDINPRNILWDAQSNSIKIIDFGIATELSREKQHYNTDLLKGSLPFISPEQTGRMNRSIDYRSDYYSLGATFYYLLSGEHAYDADDDDPMSWIHCHIAKQPNPLMLANPSVNQALSALIFKLMAKNAEDRYQSAAGIKHDLERCQAQWQQHGVVETLIPGTEDITDRFEIQQKLYGREQEVSALMDAFADIRVGASTMFLVSGFSGIGKSALINEVHKPIVAKQGYFIRGKFDQYQRNIPYSAIAKAFAGLMKQLLTESQDRLKDWQQQLLEILGPNAQVIIDFVPELEQIIGPQPQVAHLGTEENQNRFNQVALQFLLLFTRNERPLVMFIDDLQWADSASLNLIRLFMLSQEHSHFLFLGAYRDNEVDQHHPFIVVVNELKQVGVSVSDLTLEALKLEHVNALISESLYLEHDKTLALAQLVVDKTGGNPFFINQFLKNAYETGLLSYSTQDKSWHWDLAQIEQQQSSENVVDLVVSKMDRLPAAAQQLLSLGACIGNVFDLQTLSIISEQPMINVAIDLWPAVQTGLLLTDNDAHALLKGMSTHERVNELDYPLVQERFLHDKVQQAAYSFIEDSQKQQVHLSIARLLLQKTPEHELDNHYFDIVEHYNRSIELINHDDERRQLAELNLKTAEKAQAATAYAPALQYFNQAARCLQPLERSRDSQLHFAIDKGRIECHFLLSEDQSGLQLAEDVLKRCDSIEDKVELNNILILYHGGAGQMDKAIDIALDSLCYFDVKLPRNPNLLQLLLELARAKINLGRKSTEQLKQLPSVNDDNVHAAFSLLKELIAPTYLQGLTNLLPYIILRMFNLNLKHGNGPVSAFTYAGYGLLWSKLDDFKEAHRFGVLAMDYNKQVDNPPMEARCYFMATSFSLYWRQSFQESQQPRKLGLQKLIDTGEYFWASYIYLFGFWQEVVLSKSLDDIFALTEREINFAQKAKQIEPYYVHILHRNLFKNLAGLTVAPDSLDVEDDEEQQALAYFETNVTSTMGKFYHVVCRLVLHYQREQFQQALDIASQDFINEDVIRDGTFTRVIYTFFTCLTALALASDSAPPSSIYPQYKKRKNKLKQWFNLCPENFSCMWNLVLAEQARVENRETEAINYFDQALTAAKRNQSLFFESLTNELYAKFWFKRGNQKVAAVFMTEAGYLYYRWGATGKLEFLQSQHASLFNQHSAAESSIVNTKPTTETATESQLSTTYKDSSLDLNTLVKASQTLSGEIVLEKLLQKLMHFLIENAGADKGIVILNENDQLVIVTRCSLAQGEEQLDQQAISLDDSSDLSQSLIRYVARSKELVVLDDAATSHRFAEDNYFQSQQIKSVLCLPLLHKGDLTGILYLENNLANNTFTPDRVETLQVLSSEIVISLENARLYRNLEENNQTLEQKVQERTAVLHSVNQTLQNKNLEVQNSHKIIQEINSNITKSINYAQRIQHAILPQDQRIAEQLSEFFIIFKPKEIVSGDFYWFNSIDDKHFLVVADCTGHGVPGAFLSMIGSMLLNKIIMEKRQLSPALILEELHADIRLTLQQADKKREANDGMDIGLCQIDLVKRTLIYAGAKRPLYLYRQGKQQFLKIPGDRKSIGGRQKEQHRKFTNHTIHFLAGDMLYLSSDGFVDQNNVQGKKFGSMQFESLLEQGATLDPISQKQRISDALNQYQDQESQRDDISLIGVKLS